MNIQQAAQAALDAQSACNLSGIVHSFSKIATDVLWPIARAEGKGTDFVNGHPISVLFADKIAALAGVQGITTESMAAYSAAYTACKRIAESEVADGPSS